MLWIEMRVYLQEYPQTKAVRNPRNLPTAQCTRTGSYKYG
jgi:hypothetical protein